MTDLDLALFGVELAFLLVLVPETIDLADVAGSSESADFVLVDVFHQFRELVLAEQGLEFNALLAAVAANDLIHRAAALQFVDDEVAQAIVVLRYNADK